MYNLFLRGFPMNLSKGKKKDCYFCPSDLTFKNEVIEKER